MLLTLIHRVNCRLILLNLTRSLYVTLGLQAFLDSRLSQASVYCMVSRTRI